MSDKSDYHYDDGKLDGLDIANLILGEWASGRYQTIAGVTSAVHALKSELPRSVIFWLAYHTLHEMTGRPGPQAAALQTWPQR